MIPRGWRPERWLLIAASLCLAAVLARNSGVRAPVLDDVWNKAYNGVEFLAVAVCALRAWRARGGERAAGAFFPVGLFGSPAGDLYYPAAFMDVAPPPYPSW